MINNKAKSPPASRQPGELMWNAGIYYMADGFTFDSTKPIVQWIIEKNLLPSNERPKELTLVSTVQVVVFMQPLPLLTQ